MASEKSPQFKRPKEEGSAEITCFGDFNKRGVGIVERYGDRARRLEIHERNQTC